MRVKLYKEQFKRATEIQDAARVSFPWAWSEMKALDRMWSTHTPIEFEIEDDLLIACPEDREVP